MSLRKGMPTKALVASLQHSQQIVLSPIVLAHLDKHRQRSPWAKEAGGQLFGRFDEQILYVDRACGPNRNDERTRYTFRSNPEAAQRNIKMLHGEGYLYVGEWHTHAESTPRVSFADREAMQKLYSSSLLSVSALLLLIRGTADLPVGLGAYYYSFGGLKGLTLETGAT